MSEIATILDFSLHKVAYWMKTYGIKTRSRSDAMYKKLNPTGDPFTIKELVTTQDFFLMGLGLGIYWGEGNKISLHAVRVTNSDPKVISTFRRFLKEICGVDDKKIRYSIVCFNDSSTTECKRYWSEMLQITSDNFGKIVQIPTQGKGTYTKKSQFGVCTITVSNIKLKTWIMKQIVNI